MVNINTTINTGTRIQAPLFNNSVKLAKLFNSPKPRLVINNIPITKIASSGFVINKGIDLEHFNQTTLIRAFKYVLKKFFTLLSFSQNCFHFTGS